MSHIDLYGLYETAYWKNYPPEKTYYPIYTNRYISDASFAYGAIHGAAKFGASFASTSTYLATLPFQTASWALGGISPLAHWHNFESLSSFDFKTPSWMRSDLYHESSFSCKIQLNYHLLDRFKLIPKIFDPQADKPETQVIIFLLFLMNITLLFKGRYIYLNHLLSSTVISLLHHQFINDTP